MDKSAKIELLRWKLVVQQPIIIEISFFCQLRSYFLLYQCEKYSLHYYVRLIYGTLTTVPNAFVVYIIQLPVIKYLLLDFFIVHVLKHHYPLKYFKYVP